MKKHTCRDCLLISICKNRPWPHVINKCQVIGKYIFGEYYGDALHKNRKDQEQVVRSRVQRTFIEMYPNTWKPALSGDTWHWVTKVVKE